MLTKVDKLLLALWLLPLAIGGGAALNAGGDERIIILFVTGITALMYVIAVISMSYYARRRRSWAQQMAREEADHDHVEGRLTVGAQEPPDLSRRHGEVEAVQGRGGTEGLDEPAGLDHRGVHGSS